MISRGNIRHCLGFIVSFLKFTKVIKGLKVCFMKPLLSLCKLAFLITGVNHNVLLAITEVPGCHPQQAVVSGQLLLSLPQLLLLIR